MIADSKNDYINYRFQRALEAYDEAVILSEKLHWNAAINRLYYACYYAVIALLIKHNIETKTHDGTKNQFNFCFVKTKIVDIKQGKLFSKLFDFRQKGDYGDMFNFDEEMVAPLFSQVYDFISNIKFLVYK